jgi:carboxyl-terminal processing protease
VTSARSGQVTDARRYWSAWVEPGGYRTRITVIVEWGGISLAKERTTVTSQMIDEGRDRSAVFASLCRRWRAGAAATIVVGAFALGLVAGGSGLGRTSDAVAESSLTGRPEFATLEETWELIHEKWPDPEQLDDTALMYGAAEGMVAAIGDEGHSGFLDPTSAKEMEQAQEAEYVGIGVEVDSRCGVPVVASTMTGSPAEAAGLQPGDVIAEVDDVSTRRMDMRDLRDLILGKEGDNLTLTIERPNEPDPLRIDVTRQTIERHPVTWRWLPESTVHLRITDFQPGVNQKVRNALETIRQEGAHRLILDLRGNPGGLVPEVIGVASEFLDEGSTIFLEKERDQEARPIQTVGRTGSWLDLALVVLIDDDSASGAEVLAAALRDNGRAQLIGETTFGTGTVLSTFPQDDGSSVVLATAFWLTPEGDPVWKEGVEPDHFVALAKDAFPSRPEDDPELTESELEGSADAQLRAAFAVLGDAPPAP